MRLDWRGCDLAGVSEDGESVWFRRLRGWFVGLVGVAVWALGRRWRGGLVSTVVERLFDVWGGLLEAGSMLLTAHIALFYALCRSFAQSYLQ
jgi:hypothetical protein